MRLWLKANNEITKMWSLLNKTMDTDELVMLAYSKPRNNKTVNDINNAWEENRQCDMEMRLHFLKI